MLVAIKKYKFYITKIKFYRFIIKLRKFSINLKKLKQYLISKDLEILWNYNCF